MGSQSLRTNFPNQNRDTIQSQNLCSDLWTESDRFSVCCQNEDLGAASN